MANVTAAPTLETAFRKADRAFEYTWTNRAATSSKYTWMGVYTRKLGDGTWQLTSSFGYPTISNQKSSHQARPAAYGGGWIPVNEAWQVSLRAFSQNFGYSAYSNVITIPAEETKPPVFNSVTRISETAVRVNFDPVDNNAAKSDAVYAYMRVAGTGDALTQVNRTTASNQRTFDIYKYRGASLDGSKAYEIELNASGVAGASTKTSRKTAPAWWQIPPGISNLRGDWVGTELKLAWEAAPTDQAPFKTQKVQRAEGSLGQFGTIATIAGTKRDYTDKTAKVDKEYRYRIVPNNALGDATSLQTITVRASVLTPGAPTTVTLEYTDKDKATAKWKRNATTDRPYTSQRVLVRDVGTETWVPQALLPGAATEQILNLGGNRFVEVAIEAINAAGSTTSEVSQQVATTPARPGSLEAFWSGPNKITVRWPRISTIAGTYVLEFSRDGITWYPAPVEAPLTPSTPSWEHTGVTAAQPHFYRLKATKATPAGTPDSTWVQSGVVEAQTKPRPPTIMVLESVDAREAIQLGFIHNPVDGTDQTAAKVRFRKQGAAGWNIRTLTTAAFTTIAADTYTNGDVIEVAAQTAGAAGDLSDWSQTALFTLRARPEVLTLSTTPGTSRTVSMGWTASSQASAVAELLIGSVVIESQTVGAGPRSVTWRGLVDRTTYTMRVTVRDQWQDSLPRSTTVAVALVRPGKPTGTGKFRIEDGAVILTAASGSGTSYMEAFRVLKRGEPLLVARFVGNVVEELYPPLGQENLVYVIRAHGPQGGYIDSDPIYVNTFTCDMFLHYNGGMARGGWEPSYGGTAGRASVPLRYLGKTGFAFGRKDDRTATATVLIDPRDGDTPVEGWIEAAEAGDVVYRDPSGKVLHGALTGFSYNDSSILEQSVTFTVTAGGEERDFVGPKPLGDASTVNFAQRFLNGVNNG